MSLKSQSWARLNSGAWESIWSPPWPVGTQVQAPTPAAPLPPCLEAGQEADLGLRRQVSNMGCGILTTTSKCFKFRRVPCSFCKPLLLLKTTLQLSVQLGWITPWLAGCDWPCEVTAGGVCELMPCLPDVRVGQGVFAQQ